jgi:hypothetical protein
MLEPRVQALFAGPPLRRGPPLAVKPRLEPLWAAMGWHQEENSYRGQFHVNGRSWAGLITVPYPGGYMAYIWDPPLREFRANHPHRPCFQNPQPDGACTRYTVHFHTMPNSIDHAITAIEDVLKDALRR